MKLNPTKPSLYKPKSMIRYYDPYVKLNFRAQVNAAIYKQSLTSKFSPSNDIPAILDAFLKRNGYQEVRKRGRLEEIRLSLSFYLDKDFLKIYQEEIVPYEKYLLRNLKGIPAGNSSPFIQQHLLPVGLHNSYYELSPEEQSFVKDYFASLDEYFCLKTLVYFGCNLDKLNPLFLQKYYKVKKWAYLHGNGDLPKSDQLLLMKLPNQIVKRNMKVCIIGINLANIVLAHKLSILGATVKIFDSNMKKIKQMKEGYLSDCLKQGIFVANEGQNLMLRKVLQQYMNTKPEVFKQQDNQTQELHFNNIPYNIYVEQSLLTMLQQIINEPYNNSKKLISQELINKVKSRNSINSQQRYYRGNQANRQQVNPQNILEINIMRIHLQRYIIFNKLKDEATLTTNDFRKYLDSYYECGTGQYSKMKMGLVKQAFYLPNSAIKETGSLLDRILESSENPLVNLDVKFEQAEFENKKWIITYMNQDESKSSENFTHLIYGDEHFLEEAINQKNYTLKNIKGTIVQEGFPILQQLSSHHQIHCLYIFSEPVAFKTAVIQNLHYFGSSYAAYISEYGIIHFSLIKNTEVLATLRYNKKLRIDFYREIFGILTSNILANSYKILPNETLVEEAMYFTLKDDKFYDNLIKAREEENLYFSVPVFTVLGHRNIIQTHLAANTKIYSWIIKDLERSTDFYNIDLPEPEPVPSSQSAKAVNYYTATKSPPERLEKSLSRDTQKDRYHRHKQSRYDKNIYKENNEKSREHRSPRDRENVHSEHSYEERSIYNDSNLQQSQNNRKNLKLSREQSQFSVDKSIVSNHNNEKSDEFHNNSDFFGSNHPRIREYRQRVSTEIEKYIKINSGFKIPQLCYNMGNTVQKLGFQLAHQYLYSNVFLYSVGHPKIIDTLTRNKTTLKYIDLNGFTTRRQYYSLVDPEIMTVYYQCIVVVDDKQYYCMVDQVVFHNHAQQIQKQVVYYHTDLQVLQEKFNMILKSMNPKINLKEEIVPTLLNHLSLHILPDHMFSAVIASLIRKELEVNDDIDSILNSKLEGKSIIPDTCYTLYQRDSPKYIITQIQEYLSSLLINNKIKNFSLSDIFFGKFDILFIFSEMIEVFGRSPMQQEIDNIYEKAQAINRQKKYPLEIRYNQKNKSVVISRMFLNFVKEEQNFMRVYEMKVSEESEWLKYYYRTNLDSNNKLVESIIEFCLRRFRSYEIINFFKDLIFNQLQQSQKLKDQLSQLLEYFKMTRTLNLPPMIERTDNFISEAKRILQNQTNIELDEALLRENYECGNIKMIGSDILCLK